MQRCRMLYADATRAWLEPKDLPLKNAGWLLGLLVAASCDFPRPADVGPAKDGSDDPGITTCQITAISPSIANTDDPITIEGTFADVVTVNFPGGTSVAATLLGPHRASVRVPATATEGDLTVTTCGSTLGTLSFRRASFALGLGKFVDVYDQAAVARQYPRLVVPRDSHTTTVIGNHLYVAGGAGRSGSLDSVEQALVNADGTIGRLAVVPDVTLVSPRQAHTTTVIRDQVYVVGGFGGSSLASVEHASVGHDGSIGQFTRTSGVALVTARQGHATVVVGSYLYVLGGSGNSTLNSIERSSIHADGSLGPFAIVPGVTLATARYGHTAFVAGSYLYVLGGSANNGVLKDVERATLNSDGSLSPFVAVSGNTLTTSRSGHSIAVFGNYVYVFGGVGTSGSLASVERAPLDAGGVLGSFEMVSGIALKTSRHGHTTTAVGNSLYVLGGSGDAGPLEHGEHASLNISGSLGPFSTVSGVTLLVPRAFYCAAVTGNYLYAVGGSDSTGPLSSVERATINSDGSLARFEVVRDVVMTGVRQSHAAAVIGPYLYALGGFGSNFSALSSVERAIINPDGSLGSFSLVPGVALMTARGDHTAAIVGNALYVFGGRGSDGIAVPDIEFATINSDGSLGPFSKDQFHTTMTARYYHATTTIGRYLYIISGYSDSGPLSTLEQASIEPGVSSSATLSGVTLSARRNLTAAVIGHYLYTLGGLPSSIERATIGFDDSLGTFDAASGTLATSRFAHATVVVKNYVYVAAGFAGRGTINTVESAQLK
jgi:hypothetical protein